MNEGHEVVAEFGRVVRRLRHRIAHRLGLNTGRVETWWAHSGKLMVGFRCSTCGKLEGIHPCKIEPGAEHRA